MVIALPFGLAGIALLDLCIGIGILIIILLAFATLRWTVNATVGLVGGLPIIGGAAVNAVQRFGDAIWNLARGFEEIQATYVWNVSVRLVQLLNATVGVAFQPWAILISNTNNIANEARADAWYILGQWIPFVTNWITNTSNIANEARALVWGLSAHVYQVVEVIANEARARVSALETHVSNVVEPIANEGRALARSLAPQVAVLWGFLPLLQALAAFEGGALARIATLEADLAFQRGRVQVLEQNLARVMPLAVVAAIGATAVLNLERVARDPCHCLTLGDFSDLGDRVAALESLGP